jgi:iron complex outermembrane receptor protein
VPADTLSIERVEVLRGPGALLYRCSAVGSVGNVIDSVRGCSTPGQPFG